MTKKERLDILLVQRELAPSRTKASAMIMAAEVHVDGQISDKPGMRVSSEAEITLKAKPRYVGRGGLKLEGALKAFTIDVNAMVCADVGASTGGFTDCLLQNGAIKVYAIDVGHGIIDYGLRMDERVVLLENTNVRYLESIGEAVDLIVIDVSFISLKLILPVVKNWLKTTGNIIALVKPQFEAGRKDVGKGGIVKDPAIHRRVLEDIFNYVHEIDLVALDVIVSPITGQKGNIEYLMWLQSGKDIAIDSRISDKIIQLTQFPT